MELPGLGRESLFGVEGPRWKGLEQDETLPSVSWQAQFSPARLPEDGQTLLGARSPEGARLMEHLPWGSCEQAVPPTRGPVELGCAPLETEDHLLAWWEDPAKCKRKNGREHVAERPAHAEA